MNIATRPLDLTKPREKILHDEFEMLVSATGEPCEIRITDKGEGSFYLRSPATIAIDLESNDSAKGNLNLNVEHLDLISLAHECSHLLQDRWMPKYPWTLILEEGVADYFAGFWLRKRNLLQSDFPYNAIVEKVKYYRASSNEYDEQLKASGQKAVRPYAKNQYPSAHERGDLLMAGTIAGALGQTIITPDLFNEFTRIVKTKIITF